MSNSVDFWYLLISLRATVPGLYLWGFFTPPVAGALLRAALVASCLRGAFPPVDFLAVCLVRAITDRFLLIYPTNWSQRVNSKYAALGAEVRAFLSSLTHHMNNGQSL